MNHYQYYEAILQVRPINNELTDFIKEEIKKRPDIKIAKIEELKTGMDIYLSSIQFTKALGKKLKDKFKGKVIISNQLHHTDKLTSKQKYRVTVLFRLKQEDL